ncbi:MAG: CBS domain-containing protein [Deltaproteobacteria bacterium]|nr:CBS domain-containing protein [Deltaproteobacteria bacterium]
MKTLLVRDLMTEDVFSVGPKDRLSAVFDLMVERHVRHVPVVDDDRALLGIVSHRDLVKNLAEGEVPVGMQRQLLTRIPVDEIMTRDVETVDPETTIGEAGQLMIDNKISCLPVVDGDELVGILTESDFVRCVIDRL